MPILIPGKTETTKTRKRTHLEYLSINENVLHKSMDLTCWFSFDSNISKDKYFREIENEIDRIVVTENIC